jgi:hypothetical protein
MFAAKRKPKKCPSCGSAKIARILYGMPDFSPELEKDLEEGRIVLGGCDIIFNNPSWQCADCEAQIYKEDNVIFSS